MGSCPECQKLQNGISSFGNRHAIPIHPFSLNEFLFLEIYVVRSFAQCEHGIGEPDYSPLMSKRDAEVKLDTASKDCNQ